MFKQFSKDLNRIPPSWTNANDFFSLYQPISFSIIDFFDEQFWFLSLWQISWIEPKLFLNESKTWMKMKCWKFHITVTYTRMLTPYSALMNRTLCCIPFLIDNKMILVENSGWMMPNLSAWLGSSRLSHIRIQTFYFYL
jgi:hypothetical protein